MLSQIITLIMSEPKKISRASVKTAHGWKKYAAQLYIRFKDDDLPSLSAQLSFYLLFSLFPFLLFLLNVLSYTAVSPEAFTENVARFLPGDVNTFFRDLVSEMAGAKSAALLSVSAAAALWGASRGVHAISVCLNKACDKNEDRPFWKVTIITVFFTVCIAAMVLITLLFLIFGKIIGQNLLGYIHAENIFPWVWTLLRYAVPIVMMFLVFFLLYKFIPNCQQNRREVLPGALFSTAGWIITSLVFAFYVNHFAGFTRIYGSIGAVILLMTWLYISSVVLLLGGEINATIAYFKAGKKFDKYENAKLELPFPFNRKRKPGK